MRNHHHHHHIQNYSLSVGTTAGALLLLLTRTFYAHGFAALPSSGVVGSQRPFDSTASSSSSCLHAIGVLARKAKETNVKKFLESGDVPSEVLDLLAKLENNDDDGGGTVTTPGPLQTALTKRRGTITVVAEYKRRLERGAFIDEIYDPALLSPTFREFGAAAVAVMADERMGGCDYGDLRAVFDEQETARGDVPGPLPLISSDLVVHPVQLAQSKVAGCAGVLLRYGTLSPDTFAALLQQARRLDLEAVVQVDDQAEAQAAVDAGATMLMLTVTRGVGVGGAAAAAKDDAKSDGEDSPTHPQQRMNIVSSLQLPEDSTVPICAIANLLAYDDKGLQEVEDAWVCRDAGFQAVWVSEVLYKSGNDAYEHPGAIINSMKSKSSVKWASVKARGGKGEGAREYLGDILM